MKIDDILERAALNNASIGDICAEVWERGRRDGINQGRKDALPEGYRRGLEDAAEIANQHGITWGKVIAKTIRANFAVVPREPTNEMLAAVDGIGLHEEKYTARGMAINAYKAMLSAAEK